MQAFIQEASTISPLELINQGRFPDDFVLPETNRLKAWDPDYKEYIPPAMLRRMSRVLKLGVGAGLQCLKKAAIESPDAIITGTGLGCVEDSEVFLQSIHQNQENFLTPTPFIQSTHNAISGQIALFTHCHGYNFTYVHRSFSFESALLDAMMMLGERKNIRNILVGNADELTDHLHRILGRLGQLKTTLSPNTSLIEQNSKGSIAGEGASAFLLSGIQTDKSTALIQDVSMLYRPENSIEIRQHLTQFLERNQLDINDLDVIFTGMNGDEKNDKVYREVFASISKDALSYYKHLSGEFHTSTGFATYLANLCIQQQYLPSYCSVTGTSKNKISNILIYNHFFNKNHSFLLLRSC